MVEEPLTDEQRRILVMLAVQEQLARPSPELLNIISRLSGVDTVLVARRAYASRHWE